MYLVYWQFLKELKSSMSHWTFYRIMQDAYADQIQMKLYISKEIVLQSGNFKNQQHKLKSRT